MPHRTANAWKTNLCNEILANEVGAGRVLDRRCARRAWTNDAVERRAQLPGAQLHARPDASRRRRAVLSLELRDSRSRRACRSSVGCVSGRIAVRQEEPVLRPGIQARCAALVQ